jgi:SAM-dependent methyltransferase
MSAVTKVDFFDKPYSQFDEQVLVTIREQTFGEDIGQTSWVTVDEYDAYIPFLRLTPGARTLEVASGSGGPSVYLALRTGCSVTGIDVNPFGIATATQAATRAGVRGRVRFQKGDATRLLPFAQGTFDALLCLDSMNHFLDRDYALREWWRVLRPGGRAVFTDPVVITGPVTDEEIAQRSAIGRFVFMPRGINEELIARTGFTLVKQLDLTENAAQVSQRWRESRERFREDLVRMEGEARYYGVQGFLDSVHRLTAQRRLSRVAYLVEKPWEAD